MDDRETKRENVKSDRGGIKAFFIVHNNKDNYTHLHAYGYYNDLKKIYDTMKKTGEKLLLDTETLMLLEEGKDFTREEYHLITRNLMDFSKWYEGKTK